MQGRYPLGPQDQAARAGPVLLGTRHGSSAWSRIRQPVCAPLEETTHLAAAGIVGGAGMDVQVRIQRLIVCKEEAAPATTPKTRGQDPPRFILWTDSSTLGV